jgi:hypothetical protein
LPLTTGVTGTLLTDKGGTGQSAYTAGDTTYYASGTALTKLPIGASTFMLTSSGTAPQWTNPTSVTVGNATSAVTATNLAGGATWRVPYQTGAGATTFLPAPTVAGSVILWNGTSVAWGLGPASESAINLVGGSAGVVPYQSAAGVTSFTAVGAEGRVLTSHSTASPTWEAAVSQADVNQTSIAFSLIFGG